MFKKIGDFFAEKVRKVLPDTFVFAIILAIVTIILAAVFTDLSFKEIIGGFGKGFFDTDIIMFAFLLMMGLTFGYAIGVSTPFKKLFSLLAGVVSKPWQTYLTITIVSIITMLIHWGLAPVLALFTVELCKRVRGVDYRLATTATYAGMLTWHGGLSSSAAHFLAMEETAQGFIEAGVIDGIIPVTETLGIPINFILIGTTFILLPVIILLLQPKNVDEKWDAALHWSKQEESAITESPDTPAGQEKKQTIAEWLNNSPIVSIVFGLLCIIIGFGIMKMKGFNLAVLVLFSLGIALWMHLRPISFIDTVKTSIRGSSDILLQFPLFGGINGLFIASGIAVAMAGGLTAIASETTYSWFAFITASIVNIFVPSGGGEWVILGAPLLEGAKMVGASLQEVTIAFGYGDALTNLINPFWTLAFLPILSNIMDIRPRDFMGYAAFICIIFFIVESAIFILL